MRSLCDQDTEAQDLITTGFKFVTGYSSILRRHGRTACAEPRLFTTFLFKNPLSVRQFPYRTFPIQSFPASDL